LSIKQLVQIKGLNSVYYVIAEQLKKRYYVHIALL